MNWKLLVGRLTEAWAEYPSVRRKVASIPHGPPIFLTGTHRSGTTWLARMLADSGVWYVHEPFSPKKGRRSRSFEFRSPAPRDKGIDDLFSDVLSGGFRSALNLPNSDHPMMPLRIFRPRFERLMVKDPLACLLTEYLTQNFGLQTLILFRHPAGFAASVTRLGWPRGSFLRAFLEDDALMGAHLEGQRSLMERYAGEDSLASAAVLHGALNRVLWSCAERGLGTPLLFEELCADPIHRLKALFETVGLPYCDRVADAHRRACFGTALPAGAYHPHAVARNSREMARSWTKELDEQGAAVVRGIWERFEVPLYINSSDWSRAEFMSDATEGSAH